MYDALEMCLVAERLSGSETVLGAQDIRGLWRIYPLTSQAHAQLLTDGLPLQGHSVRVYDKNSSTLSGQDTETPVTKLWISDIPISRAEADLESTIVRLGCIMRSKVIQEKNRRQRWKTETLSHLQEICVYKHYSQTT